MLNILNPLTWLQRKLGVSPEKPEKYPVVPAGSPVLKDAQTGNMVIPFPAGPPCHMSPAAMKMHLEELLNPTVRRDVHTLTPEERAADGIKLVGQFSYKAADIRELTKGYGPTDRLDIYHFLLGKRKTTLDEVRSAEGLEAQPIFLPPKLDNSDLRAMLDAASHEALPDTPVKAEEIPMATAPVVPAPTQSKFKSIMQHVLEVLTFGLADVIKYAPPVEALAEVLFPEYIKAEQAAKDAIVKAVTLVQNSVITIQAKYKAATAGNETNAAKLADVLTLAGPAAISLLTTAGVKNVDNDRITNAVNATVAILKTSPVAA